VLMTNLSSLARAISLGIVLIAGTSTVAAQTTVNAFNSTFPGGTLNQWPTYSGDLGGQRYSPLDQINAENFKDLQIAWRISTNEFGPRPDTLYSATPLHANGMLYTTAGTSRTVVAIDPGTGEVKWRYTADEGNRGTAGARQGAGRGVAWWSDAATEGGENRIIYVTPGYQMVAL